MALECIRLLTSCREGRATSTNDTSASGPEQQSSMLIFSADGTPPFRSLKLRGKRPNCIACSSAATITPETLTSGSLDYAVFCGITRPIRILGKEERISASRLEEIRSREASYTLVDVRDEAQYSICSLGNSINIPMAVIQAASAKVSTQTSKHEPKGQQTWLSSMRALPKEDRILVICRFGNDSQLAVQALTELGLANGGRTWIGDIIGGFKAWKDEVDPQWPEY